MDGPNFIVIHPIFSDIFLFATVLDRLVDQRYYPSSQSRLLIEIGKIHMCAPRGQTVTINESLSFKRSN